MVGIANNWEGGTDGVAPTTGNSGGASGNAFSSIVGSTSIVGKFSATSPLEGTLSLRLSYTGNQSAAYIWILPATADRYAIGMRFRTNGPASGRDELVSLRPLSGSTVSAYITAAGQIEVGSGSATYGTTTGDPITWGANYYLELAAKVSTGTVEMNLYALGSATPLKTISLTGQTLGSASVIGRYVIGRAGLMDLVHQWDNDENRVENLASGFPTRTDLTGTAPTVVTAPRGLVAITAPTPTIRTSAVVAAPRASLLLTGSPPTAKASASVQAPRAVLAVTGSAPAVRTSATISAPRAVVSLLGLSPALRTSARVSAPTGSLLIVGRAPTVVVADSSPDVRIAAPRGTLTILGRAPTVRVGALIAAPSALLQIRGAAPTVRTSARVVSPRALVTLVALVPMLRTGAKLTASRGLVQIIGRPPLHVGVGRPWRDIELSGGLSRSEPLTGRVERHEITGTVRG